MGEKFQALGLFIYLCQSLLKCMIRSWFQDRGVRVFVALVLTLVWLMLFWILMLRLVFQVMIMITILVDFIEKMINKST